MLTKEIFLLSRLKLIIIKVYLTYGANVETIKFGHCSNKVRKSSLAHGCNLGHNWRHLEAPAVDWSLFVRIYSK